MRIGDGVLLIVTAVYVSHLAAQRGHAKAVSLIWLSCWLLNGISAWVEKQRVEKIENLMDKMKKRSKPL